MHVCIIHVVLHVQRAQVRKFGQVTFNSTLVNLAWRAKDGTYSEYLINLTAPWKQWPKSVHFSHNATNSPQVHRTVVVTRAQQDFGGSIPGIVSVGLSYLLMNRYNVSVMYMHVLYQRVET